MLARQAKAIREQQLFASPDGLDKVLYECAQGRGVVAFCKERDIRYTAVAAWLEADPDRNAQYQLALKARGAVTVAQLQDVIKRTVSGELDPRRAAVVTKPLQWLASVMDRKQFGEQQTLNVKHSLADEHLAALKQVITVQQPQGVHSPRADGIATTAIADAEFRALPAPTADLLSSLTPDPLADLLDTQPAPAEQGTAQHADPFDV